jgi:acyl-CoA synthetase (AMP-forming)/AMP-acid ligase II
VIDQIRRHPPEHVALIEPDGRALTYGALLERIAKASARLREAAGGPALALLAGGSDPEAVILYLACLDARLPVCLCDGDHEGMAALARAYAPELLLLPRGLAPPRGDREALAPSGSYEIWRHEPAAPRALDPGLALLLTTSGSTGSPKVVRLTLRNLAANADSIARYLELGPGERAIQSLPIHYSYGLSVLNSHLAAGRTFVMTAHSFMRPEFWAAVDASGCTSFAGVPYMYETLRRLRFDPASHPSVRTLTQAGGALSPAFTSWMLESTERAQQRFFVMYGQTEATARISYVPPARLRAKIGSIGIPIPDGRLALAPNEEAPGVSELVYEGPNVMMGYAETSADLALGDVQHGRLRTGDLGRVDDEGYYFLTGRLRRIAKLFGHRVSLEDVERHVESRFPARVAAVDGGDRVLLYAEPTGRLDLAAIANAVSKHLGVPPAAVVVREVEAIPRTATGKKDYRAIAELG